jgi:hypothetical protein
VIVAACVGVFLLFGALVHEQRTPSQVLEEVRSGRPERRWPAAFELSKLLDDPAAVRSDPRLVGELMRAFEAERHQDDPRVRRFLALSLGKLKDPAPADLLARSLDERDSDTRLYALLSLGVIGNASHASAVVPLLGSDDPGLRKAAAFVLGSLGGAAATAGLREALGDPALEVRWNAALALVRLHDPAGFVPTLKMLERRYVSGAPGITPGQIEAALLAAIGALEELRDPGARPALEKLGRGDPNPAVRQAALRALSRLPPARPRPGAASELRPEARDRGSAEPLGTAASKLGEPVRRPVAAVACPRASLLRSSTLDPPDDRGWRVRNARDTRPVSFAPPGRRV